MYVFRLVIEATIGVCGALCLILFLYDFCYVFGTGFSDKISYSLDRYFFISLGIAIASGILRFILDEIFIDFKEFKKNQQNQELKSKLDRSIEI
jgi:hypothetical protein